MLGRGLAWVALVVDDVEAAARGMERDLELPRFDCPAGRGARRVPVLPVGAAALALFAPGDPFVGGERRTGVHHVAVAVEDLGAAARTARFGVSLPAPEPGLAGAGRVALAPEATAGVRVWLTEPLVTKVPDGNGRVERIDHVGVASADNEAAIDVFTRRLGFPLESTQTDLEIQMTVESFTSDRYGVVHHAREPRAVGGLRVAFVTVGDCELEFLQEFDPRTGAQVIPGEPGTTRQDQGAIGRYIGARGAGLHHLALKVPDIDGTLDSLDRAGRRLIDRAGRPGSRRARIGFVHPAGFHGVLLHLVQREAR
ncbi:MAG TPA: VOC family protein [Methylomirabilota bacterium]|nr:VOC family protein [Methylomirabilota bacterium]